MTANPQSNFGFELGLFNESCRKILTFGSSKNSNPAKRPKLVVKYKLFNVGIPESKSHPSANIYPNPSNEMLEIQSSDHDLRFELYNLFSVLVFDKDNCEPHQLIDIGRLRSGVYFYRTKSFEGKSTGKIIKN